MNFIVLNLYLIRHGESKGNELRIVQGHRDFPLTKTGKRQASLLGKAISKVPLDAIYSSDLKRAYHTAEAVALHHKLQIKKCSSIREVNLGPLEGNTRKELLHRYPHLKRQSLLTSGIKGSETVASITNRCEKTLQLLMDNHHPHQEIALITHGGFISILLTYFMLGEKWVHVDRPFIIHNGSISKLELTANRKIKFHYINNTNHLL